MTFALISLVVLTSISIVLGRLYVRSQTQMRILLKEKEDLLVKNTELTIRLSEQDKSLKEKIEFFSDAETRLSHVFRSLSADVLQKNNQTFLEIAKSQFDNFQEISKKELHSRQDKIADLILPMRESLERVDQKILTLEKDRVRTEESLSQQVKSLLDAHKDLKQETSNLVTALRAPQARGMWGEMQLKRVVEMAGMLEHCDFLKQESANTETGRIRPDLVVRLPGGKNIVIDAKTPLMAFLEAIAETDLDKRKLKIMDHARQVRRHLEQLSRKSYWDQFQPAPEFVVLFLPGEAFFSAALEVDPSLIESGVHQNVILATPTTLIALLKAVAFGWRQERLAENARAVGELGKELYKRLSDLGAHFSKLGKNLDTAVDSYNAAVGTLESRVLVSARRFKELDAHGAQAEIAEPLRIERKTRELPPESLGH